MQIRKQNTSIKPIQIILWRPRQSRQFGKHQYDYIQRTMHIFICHPFVFRNPYCSLRVYMYDVYILCIVRKAVVGKVMVLSRPKRLLRPTAGGFHIRWYNFLVHRSIWSGQHHVDMKTIWSGVLYSASSYSRTSWPDILQIAKLMAKHNNKKSSSISRDNYLCVGCVINAGQYLKNKM